MSLGIMPPPFPTGDGGSVIKVINIIKTIWKLITSKPAKDVSEVDSINDKSPLDDINRITEIFENYKEQVHREAVKIDDTMYEELSYYIEELNMIIEDSELVMEKYCIKTNKIDKKIQKLLTNIKGVIDNEVCKSVSLDCTECKNIIKMIPGTKKEEAMKSYLNMSLQSALDKCCNNIKEVLEDIFEEVEEELVGAIDKAGNELDIQLKMLDIIKNEDNSEEKAKIISDANSVIASCELVLALTEG